MNNEHIIEMFKKTFVGAGKYPKRISDPILADDISDFIEEALNSQKEEIVKSIKQYKVSSPSLGGGGEELYTDNLSKEEEKIDDLLDEICQEILFPETLPDLHRSPRPEKCKHDYLLKKDLKTACVLCGEEPEEWESRFEEKFPAADYYLDGGVKADIKSFIKTEIRKAEERGREHIRNSFTNRWLDESYNKAITDAIEVLPKFYEPHFIGHECSCGNAIQCNHRNQAILESRASLEALKK